MSMHIETDENGEIVLSQLYLGVGIKTDAGMFAICQRDSGIEIRLGDGPWFSWQDPSGPVKLPGPASQILGADPADR
jgi:hypothetical protein